MSYSSRHQERREKPECYGDEDYHDPSTEECDECRFKATCRITVRRKREQEDDDEDRKPSRRSSRGRTLFVRKRGHQVRRMEEPRLERFEDQVVEPLTFWAALIANGGLSAVGACLREAQFAIDQTPRFIYPDLFAPAIERRRRRRRTEEDDY